MRPAQRLRHRQDFATVYRRGRPYRNQLALVRALPTGAALSRFGFVTPKGLRPAVARNRLKRRLREAVRSLGVRPGWDVIVVARPPAVAARYRELREAIVELFGRADLLEQTGEVTEP